MWTDARPARPHGLRSRPRGFTLIEAIIAIVVIGAALSGLLLVFQTTMARSADPMVQRQMTAVALELLEEIQLKPFTPAAHTAPSGCARDTFNDVADYNGYTANGICMIDGAAIPGLSGFAVSVAVAPTAWAGLTAADALRISITVTRGTDSFRLVGWRTNYAP